MRDLDRGSQRVAGDSADAAAAEPSKARTGRGHGARTREALLTGALHWDGLADTADGFGGGRTRDDALRIMRDPAIGSFGAVAQSNSALPICPATLSDGRA